MKVNGIHHVSALTAHAQKNYDFYVKGLGMKLIKKSVNQDEPTMYHLFYGDEVATPGSDLTFSKFRCWRAVWKARTAFHPSRFAYRGRGASLLGKAS